MEKIRYGVIGIKGIGELHSRFARQNNNVILTALADIDKEYLGQKTSQLAVRGFTDYREMLSSGLIDAVSICTPHYLHYQMCMDSIYAGVHVFAEKPLSINISDAENIVTAAKSGDIRLSVGHQYRTFRTSRTMKHLIESGQIGNVMRIAWSWRSFRPEIYYQRDTWRKTWDKAGGGISIHNIHDLDLLCWMFGKPVQVNAIMGNQLHKIDIEDYYCANILFENGAYCTIQVSINEPDICNIRQVAGDKGIIIINNVRSLTFDHKDKILLGRYDDELGQLVTKIKNPEGQPAVKWKSVKLIGDPPKWRKMLERVKIVKSTKIHGLSVLMDSFISSILTGSDPLVTGESTLTSLELLNGIIVSAFRKKDVSFPLNRDEFNEVFEELTTIHKSIFPEI